MAGDSACCKAETQASWLVAGMRLEDLQAYCALEDDIWVYVIRYYSALLNEQNTYDCRFSVVHWELELDGSHSSF